jgi:hypothetical protein
MNGPPKKERGVGTALQTAELVAAYPLSPALQAAPFPAWETEAGRLFAEFWRTGNQKHLAAFVVHAAAMRAHKAKATQ